MALLLHEIWEEPAEDGGWLPGLCLAGPDGDDFRALLRPGARRCDTFEAGSHAEAMTIYQRRLGRGPYVSTDDTDRQPYPEDSAARQRLAR